MTKNIEDYTADELSKKIQTIKADLEKEILALERERLGLLRKLKGVRAARKRDQVNAHARLNNSITTFSSIIQSLLDRRAETRADRLDFIFWHMRNALVSSCKLTTTEWEDFYLAAADAYTKKYKEEVE